MRWGKPTKNKKRSDPRYFLNESIEEESLQETLGIDAIVSRAVIPLAKKGVEKAEKLIKQRKYSIDTALDRYKPQAEVEFFLAWMLKNPGVDPGGFTSGVNLDDPRVAKIILKRQKELLKQSRKTLPSAKELG
jgi:hypothetical protein